MLLCRIANEEIEYEYSMNEIFVDCVPVSLVKDDYIPDLHNHLQANPANTTKFQVSLNDITLICHFTHSAAYYIQSMQYFDLNKSGLLPFVVQTLIAGTKTANSVIAKVSIGFLFVFVVFVFVFDFKPLSAQG